MERMEKEKIIWPNIQVKKNITKQENSTAATKSA